MSRRTRVRVAMIEAQTIPYVGGVAGISTLSADGRASISADAAAVSLYAPENGPAVNLFAGVHLSDYVSVQGNYIANSNRLTLTASAGSDRGIAFYEQERSSVQHAAIADLLAYFREPTRRMRPYLSAGLGLVRFCERCGGARGQARDLAIPSRRVTSLAAVLRVAVGIDLAGRNGWAIRYLQRSDSQQPDQQELSPAGQRGLANFQNLFGIVKSFP